MTNKKESLKNAPIKEVIIGITSDELFKSFEEIEEFYKNSKINEKFQPVHELRRFALEMNEKEAKFSKTMSIGKGYVNESQNDRINIELDKIMLIDRNKYTDFDTFANKFYFILEEILKFKKSNIKTIDIGLRYINIFTLSNEKLDEKFYVKNMISLYNREIKENYAENISNIFMTVLKSLKDENINAIVKTIREKENDVSSKIVFDIDTHIDNIEIDSIDTFKKVIIKLKEFKNEIFFSNFDNAYKIEEFNE